jgi:hypothetical protein
MNELCNCNAVKQQHQPGEAANLSAISITPSTTYNNNSNNSNNNGGQDLQQE